MYSIDSTPHTQEVWIYDLRSQMKFTLVENPLQAKDLQDFLKCYCQGDLSKRLKSERFRCFSYEEIASNQFK